TLSCRVRYSRPATRVSIRTVDMDDATPARFLHGRHECLRQVPRCGQLLVEKEVPILVRGVEEGFMQATRGIGYVDVDPTKLVFGAALHFFHGLQLAGRAHDYQRLVAECLRLMLDTSGLRFIGTAVDDHVGAAGCEFEYDRATYVASRTCDENGLAGEIEIFVDRHPFPPEQRIPLR